MNELDNMNEKFSPKSFWERPEGTTGMVVGIGAILGGGYLLYKALPYVITLLENTIYASVLGVVAFMILWVVMDKRFWTLSSYLYRSVMRWITGVFIQIDPIGILKNYIEDLIKSLARMNKHIAALQGQIRQVKNLIAQNERERDDALKMMHQAKKENKNSIITLKARKAGRLENSNTTLQQLLTKMEVLYRVLVKMYETSDVLIEDMKDEVQVKEREREAINASYSALRAAMKIMSGDPDKKAMFDQTMEYLAYDYGMKIGEIENFVRMSENFISTVDLQNGVYEEEAMRMLDEWEKKSDSLLLGDKKNTLIAQAYNPNDELDMEYVRPTASKSNTNQAGYGDFFK